MSRSFIKVTDSRSDRGRHPCSETSAIGLIGVVGCLVGFWAGLAWPCWGQALGDRGEAGIPLRPLVATFHIHSAASTGGMSLDSLADRAEALGLGAILLADNFALRYEYGLPPLRGVFRRVMTFPSLVDYGVDRYLAEVADVQARHPRVVLMPGMEVAPHYYWTGSLFRGDLTMHNSQRNVIVLGLSRAEDYVSLPVSGNPASYRWGWESAGNLAPGLLFVPAAWLWRKRGYRKIRVGVMRHHKVTRYRWAALALAGAAGVLLHQAWPLGQPAFSNYEDELGYRPYQALIDTVAERGGMTIWSMPEARDFQTKTFGRLGTVTSKTEPYPEALLTTQGYVGFGGLYEDNRTVHRPGGEWDRAIAQYLAGQRPAPPVLLGELGYHGPGHDTKELDRVLTVFWVRDQTSEAILDALRAGRAYAVHRYHKAFRFRLDALQVEAEGGRQRAGPGETLRLASEQPLDIRVRVSATDQGAYPVTVSVIRSGEVVARLTGNTPFDQRYLGDLPKGEPAVAYRIQVDGEGELLSNPVFVIFGTNP